MGCRFHSPEHIGNRFLFDVRVQVPIPATLLVCLVPNKVVDDSLIDSRSSQTGNETMPENVVSAKRFPL
jgi:hypothetical protein